MIGEFGIDALVGHLKAAAEPTRLRILVLLASGELNVTDLTDILGESQPSVSRHLRVLCEAGLVERFRDGSFVYFTLSERAGGGNLARQLAHAVTPADRVVARDRGRADALKREREKAAQAYFARHAARWDDIRRLHVDESEVEAAIIEALGPGPFGLLLDLGAGTGRILELLGPRYARGLGIDINASMLTFARAKLAAAGVRHAQVRHGDLYDLALPDGCADAVVMHQVLHFLADPGAAIREAARVLAPRGRLLIVDFDQHDHEFLRTYHAHERLGFSARAMRAWIEAAGLRQWKDYVLTMDEGDRLIVSFWQAGHTGLPAEGAPPRAPAPSSR